MTCSNCNASLSCGCQKRTASDKKSCCSKCITAYESRLLKAKSTIPKTTTEPVIINVIQK